MKTRSRIFKSFSLFFLLFSIIFLVFFSVLYIYFSAFEVRAGIVTIIPKTKIENFYRNPHTFFHISPGSSYENSHGGKGFFITNEGVILTNKHVVSDMSIGYKVITSDNREYDVVSIIHHPNRDMALLRIKPQGIVTVLDIVKTGFSIDVGDRLIAFSDASFSGVLIGIDTHQDGIESGTGFIYLSDISLAPGDSGSPLFNSKGQVIGINTAITKNNAKQSFSLSLDREFLDRFLSQLYK